MKRCLSVLLVMILIFGVVSVGIMCAGATEESQLSVLDNLNHEANKNAIYDEEREKDDCDDLAVVGAEEEAAETGDNNNTLDTAKPISLNTAYQDALSKGSEVDYFSFRLTGDSKVNLSVQHEYMDLVSSIWFFDILDSTGVSQVRFYVHGYAPNYSSGNFGLPSGKYYLKVSPNAYRSIPYTFRINSSLVSDWETESNDSMTTADNIAVNKDYHGSLVYNYRDVDYYKLNLTSASKLNIVFKHDLVDSGSERWRISISDTNGKELFKYGFRGNVATTNTSNLGLPAGTFYLKIDSSSADFDTNEYDYTFNVKSEITSEWETESNDSMTTADVIPVNKYYNGSLSGNGDVDYYKMTLDSKAKISIGFHHSVINSSSWYWNVALLDTNGNQPLKLGVAGNKEDTESNITELSEGTYYIKVNSSTFSDFDYRIIINSDNHLSTPQITGFDSLDSGVKIIWGKVTGAVKYRVYYFGSRGWTSMGDTTSTTFLDTDVSSGGHYTYSVRCVSGDGSKYQSEMNTTGWKYTYNMATPQITSLTSSDNGVQIRWNKVPNASRYRVYYYGSRGWTRMVETTDTSYLDTDVVFGYHYTYTVRCVNSDGRFTSDCNSSGWKHQHYLDTPQITGMESSSDGVAITWGKVDYAAKYRVYYLNRNGNWVKMVETASTSYLDRDVAVGYTYTYTVRCVSSDGKIFTSDCDTTGWKHTHYLDSPTITSFFSSGKGVVISWDSVGAAKYRVYYYGSKGWTRMGETIDTSFTDTDVRVGSTYRYTVRAITPDGSRFTSDCNSTGWRYTYDPKLSAPIITGCETIANGVKINWNAVANAYKYRVFYLNRNNDWVKMGDTTGTSFVDDVVSGGSTYTYAVWCLAAKDDELASGYSAPKSHTYVDNPAITQFASEKNGVRITWSKPAGATRYRVYYKNRNGGWTKMTETTADSYLDTDVSNGGHYTYTVRCVDANGSFTSWFNTSGWGYTYDYVDWSTMYYNYVMSHKNSMIWIKGVHGSSTFSVTNSTPFALHDFDKNGVPELIVVYDREELLSDVFSVYTVYKGSVTHAGCIDGKLFFLSDNPSYTGIFGYDVWDGGSRGGMSYSSFSDGKLVTKDVHTFIYRPRLSGFETTVYDQTLYNVYLDCTTAYSDVYRIPKNEVKTYTWSEIQSMGWNSFIAKYGY